MRRLAVVLAVLVAGTALSACKTTNEWENRYGELHEEYMQTVADRDEKQEHLVQALQREEVAQQQNSITQRAKAEADARAKEAADRAQQYAARVQQLEAEQVVAVPTTTVPTVSAADDDAAIQAHAAELASRAPKTSAGGVRVTEDGNIEITLESDVTFRSGDAKLTKAGEKSLRQLQSVLTADYAPYKIRVEGHTDSEPLKRSKAKWGDNFGLGSARALSVVRFMESGLSIDPVRLESASRGEHAPVAGNNTKAERSKNRRVAIVVVIPRSAALAQAK